jgi:uncharacterized protein (TIGR02996 family)
VGISDWFKPKAQPKAQDDKTTEWFRSRIADAKHSDPLALAQACSALDGKASMAFGMVVSPELQSREKLLAEALDALRAALPTMPDEMCVPVFTEIERAGLKVNTAPRRAAFDAAQREEAERVTLWLNEQIDEHARAGKIIELVDACAALRRNSSTTFGKTMPSAIDRGPILENALAALHALMPTFTAAQARHASQVARSVGLAIDLTARLAELKQERAEDVQRAREEGGDEPRNAELEREIAASFDDNGAWTVYADWLQAQGHPRGELMMLQLRDADFEEYLDAHAGVLLGALVDHQNVHDDSGREALWWRNGFIHRAHISINNYTSKTDETVVDILEHLFEHPSGRFLRELAIGVNGENDASLEEICELLGREAPPTLRVLELGAFEREDSDISYFEVGNCAPAWPKLGNLRTLIVKGASMTLGDIDLPSLEHAEFRSGGLWRTTLESISAARWPKLRRLDVWFGDSNYGADTTIDDLATLLAREDLPALTHLGLMNCEFTDAICTALGTAKIMANVETLDLSMGVLSDEGARVLVDSASLWPKLKKLDVSSTFVSDAAIEELRATYAEVVATDMRSDEEDRYVAVGE